jgi:uncharacterized protein
MPNLDLKMPTIPGVSIAQIVPSTAPELLTGVPIFFGLATPAVAKMLSLANQFEQYFSPLDGNGYLTAAVRGFFKNGGRYCYVIGLSENTLEALEQGLEASEILENVDLVCAPDMMLSPDEDNIQRMQQAILGHCEKMGDRFAILDAFNSDVAAIDQQRRSLSSHYGALYAPWLKIENLQDATRPRAIPPCGHIAGIYARSDQIGGVHNAPANIALEDVLDLTLTLTPTDQELLNPANNPGVNCLRSFRNRGMRIWGIRTLSPLSEWQYINVRRLFLTFRRWIDRNLANTIFEPNNFSLWVRLQRELSVYCESLWRQGALQGTVAQQAFYVNCNAQTNPPENREMGQVVAEIGLAPTIPGEFIRLLLVQSSSGITLN